MYEELPQILKRGVDEGWYMSFMMKPFLATLAAVRKTDESEDADFWKICGNVIQHFSEHPIETPVAYPEGGLGGFKPPH